MLRTVCASACPRAFHNPVMSDLRLFDHQPVEESLRPFWGLEATHYLRPKTPFAERLASAIEEAWDTAALADAITKDPRPEDFNVINRRCGKLFDHYMALEELFPDEEIPVEDQDTVFLGLLLVREAHRECGGAILAALNALDEEIRRQLAVADTTDDQARRELLDVRDGWTKRLAELEDDEGWDGREIVKQMLTDRMAETIDLLTEQLA